MEKQKQNVNELLNVVILSSKNGKNYLRLNNENNQCKSLIHTFKLRITNVRLNRCCNVLGMWSTTYLFLFLQSKKGKHYLIKCKGYSLKGSYY